MTKERLRKYQAILAEKKQLKQKLQEVESRLYSPKIPQITGMPGAPAHKASSAQERYADTTRALREWYAAKIEELSAEQLAIEQAIDSLEPDMRRLLRLKYMDGLTWENVVDKIGYSWSQTHRLHAKALRLLADD